MPEKDPDGEIDDVDEFLHTIGPVERDEAILNILGEGYPLPNLPGPAVDQDIADMLGTWRDNVNSEPIRDTATGQEHPMGGPWPPTNTGGTVAISEDAARLRAIPLPFGTIQQATQELDGVREQASAILGTDGSKIGEINGAIEQAKTALDGAYSMVQEVESKLGAAADHHSQG